MFPAGYENFSIAHAVSDLISIEKIEELNKSFLFHNDKSWDARAVSRAMFEWKKFDSKIFSTSRASPSPLHHLAINVHMPIE